MMIRMRVHARFGEAGEKIRAIF